MCLLFIRPGSRKFPRGPAGNNSARGPATRVAQAQLTRALPLARHQHAAQQLGPACTPSCISHAPRAQAWVESGPTIPGHPSASNGCPSISRETKPTVAGLAPLTLGQSLSLLSLLAAKATSAAALVADSAGEK